MSNSSAIMARALRRPAVASSARPMTPASSVGLSGLDPVPPAPGASPRSSSRSSFAVGVARRASASAARRVASRRICLMESCDSRRSASASRLAILSAGLACSSAIASSSPSSRRSLDIPVLATCAGSSSRALRSVAVDDGGRPDVDGAPPDPSTTRSMAASTSRSSAFILRTCSAASGGKDAIAMRPDPLPRPPVWLPPC